MATRTKPALTIIHALDDPLRYAVLSHLVAGPATVSEMIAHTGAAQSQLSNHLAILHAGGLVTRERLGRTVAYALAGPQIASILEAVDAAAGPAADPHERTPDLVLARRCYDHLAGKLGVCVFEALVERRAITDVAFEACARRVRTNFGDVRLAEHARLVFDELDVDLETLAGERRHFATACNDWTESRPHLAGALGAALQSAFFRRGWLQRRSGTRALRITPGGRRELPRRFGAAVAELLA